MTVFALALSALFLQAPAPDAAASLVPADATILVRVESLARVAELVNAFAEVGQDEPVAPARILGDLPYPGPAENVDPNRPVYLAISFAPDQPAPGMTWIVPAASGIPLGLDNSDGAFTLHTAGDYTSITSRPGVARPSAPSPLVAALPPGLVGLHLDLATLIERFRPVIDTGLRQAELAVASLPQDESVPFDIEAMSEFYFEVAHDVIDSAEALDLGLARQGRTLALRGRYGVKAGSPQVCAPAGTTAFAPLAGLIDPAAPLQFVSNGRWTDVLARLEGMMDAALDMYPESLRTDFDKLLGLQRAMADALLPGLAMGADFTGEGLRMSYVLRAKEPARILAALEQGMRLLDHGDGLLSVGSGEPFAIEGFEGKVLPIRMRTEGVLAMMKAFAGEEAGLDEAELEEAGQKFEEAMYAIYGRNLLLALAARGELVALSVAGDEAGLRTDFARLARPALPASKMMALGEEIPPSAFGLAYHFDFGQTMARMSESMREIAWLPVQAMPDLAFSFDMWGAVLERDYTGGLRLDLVELLAFVRAMQELEGK